LLASQGDEVTVAGIIVGTKTISLHSGPMILLNFGDYQRGDFTALSFSDVSRTLMDTFGDPERLIGSWVAVSGHLTIYQRVPSAPQTPQIELRRARMLRTLTPAEAAMLLGVPATNTLGDDRKTVTDPGSAKQSDLDDRLGRLYSSPKFHTKVPPRQTRVTPAPASNASTTKPRQSAPKTTVRKASPPRTPSRQRVPAQPTTARLSTPVSIPPYTAAAPPPPYSSWPYPAAPARPARQTGLGVAALIVGLGCAPAGLVLAIVSLARGERQSQADRICAWVGLVIGGLSTLACGLMALAGMLESFG
jgi:hypothetical protein